MWTVIFEKIYLMAGKMSSVDNENLIKIAIHNFEKNEVKVFEKLRSSFSHSKHGYKHPLRTESVVVNSSTLSVFGVGKREPSYSTESRYSITEHHRLRFSERLKPVLTVGFPGGIWLVFQKLRNFTRPAAWRLDLCRFSANNVAT